MAKYVVTKSVNSYEVFEVEAETRVDAIFAVRSGQGEKVQAEKDTGGTHYSCPGTMEEYLNGKEKHSYPSQPDKYVSLSE